MKEAEADVAVSHLVDEALICDRLASALENSRKGLREGLWRFRREPKERVRASARP